MAYTISLKDRAGSTVVASVPASRARFNTNLNAPGAADIVVPLRHSDVTASNFAVGQREVYISDGSSTVWGGELMAVRADASSQTLSLNAVGFYDRLRRRTQRRRGTGGRRYCRRRTGGRRYCRRRTGGRQYCRRRTGGRRYCRR